MKRFYNFLLKLTLLSLLVGFYSNAGFAAIYYVSNTGNDANSGLSTTLPWKSLTKVNAVTLAPGDQVLFQRGNTFYGTLTVKNSGSSAAPIIYGAYGTGNNPVITGFTTVSGFTSLGGNIWESTTAVSTLTTCNLVTIKGVNTPMGRTPNLGSYYTLQSHNANLSITSSNLTGTPNWTGAKVVQRKENWIWQIGKITSQSGSTINYSDEGVYVPRNNWGFFIQDDPRTLDIQNEWYFNPTTKKIRIYSTTQPTNVRVVSVDKIINCLTKNYITFSNLTITGANSTGINFSTSKYFVVSNCAVNYCGLDGIYATSSTNYTFDNNLIKNCNYSAINTYGYQNNYETITNNVIDSTTMILGVGKLYAPSSIFSNTDNSLIQYNRIDHSGYNGMMVTSDHGKIKNNFVNNSLLNRGDGGGIYTAGASIDLLIDGNIVLNTFGYTAATSMNYPGANGIYLDQKACNVTVSNNTASGCNKAGYLVNKGNTNKFINNTSYNNKYSQFEINNGDVVGHVHSHIVTGNLFIAKQSSQYVGRFQSFVNDIKTFISSSNYNYWARPIEDNKTIWAGQPDQYSAGLTDKTLTQWQTFMGQDLNSKKSPKTITNENDFQFEYNDTKTVKTIYLSSSMMDIKGAKYSGSITLQPFTSIVLLKDGTLTTASAPSAPTSVVATAGDASAKVTFVAPTNNGGSAITGYTVSSYPGGGIDANAGSTSLTHTITGLTNGTAYTFTVKATNAVGTSLASATSNSVIPKATIVTTNGATSYTFTSGRTYGYVYNLSQNFTVTPNGPFTGTITISFNGTGSAGILPKTLTFSNSSTAQTFTIQPTVAGTITLSSTNNGGLINPLSLKYTSFAVAPGAPTSVVATAGSLSAGVTFKAPLNTGGTAITGYTVISNPVGGVDAHAGSSSLNHSMTGLKNGVYYTFTVKAMNSAGTSVASAPSNSVMPRSGGIVYKSAQILTDQIEPVKEQEIQVDLFPNPSKGNITVRFSTQPEDGTRIDIIDMSGKKITSRIVSNMSEVFNLEDQAPGIYLVKTVLDSEERIQKLMITK